MVKFWGDDKEIADAHQSVEKEYKKGNVVVIVKHEKRDVKEVGRETMEAVVWTKYGAPDVLQIKEVEKPVPNDDEVLIKVYAATVTAGDCEAQNLNFPIWLSLPMRMYVGFRKPTRITILGQELAGEIVATGKNVTGFKEDD